jgi:hypothetical protein
VVIHCGTADAVLDYSHYRSRYGANNSDLPLVRSLRAAGLDAAACDQVPDPIGNGGAPLAVEVTLALLGVTALVEQECQGCALVPL